MPDVLGPLEAAEASLRQLDGGAERALAVDLHAVADQLRAVAVELERAGQDRDAAVAATLAALEEAKAALSGPATPPGVPRSGGAGTPVPSQAGRPSRPLPSRSGLPFCSAWRHPNATTAQVAPAFVSFEGYRGRPLDALHVFMQGDKGVTMADWPKRAWPTLKGGGPGSTSEGSLWWCARSGVPAVLTWPLLAELVPPLQERFVACARGDYDNAHRQAAKQVRDTGARIVAVRLGHEINMGNPDTAKAGKPTGYAWSLAYAQGDFDLAGRAWARIADLIRNELPGVPIDLNSLRNFDQACTYGRPLSTVYGAFLDHADILSGEGYLNVDCTNAAQLAAYMTSGVVEHPAGPETWAACAQAHGKWYAVPEWGPAVPPGRDALRDYPDYVRAMWDHFVRWSPILAYEANFGNDALVDGTGAHSLWNPVSVIQCSAAYRECYAPKWARPA